MAVSIDTVYQRVLVLANKEQRGYITPQEFNLFANQAQMDIFEQYFYDINQFGRFPGNGTEYSDMLNYLEEKISLFENSKNVNINANGEFYNIGAQITDLYRVGTVSYSGAICEKVNANLMETVLNSPLLKPNTYNPIYSLKDNKIYIYPISIIDPITVNYIKRPPTVKWTYLVTDGNPVYEPNQPDFQSFELHDSEETELVIKILQLAGITLKDPSLYQIGGLEDNKNVQQEKS